MQRCGAAAAMHPTIDGAASPRAAAAGDRPADGGSGDIAATTKVYTNPLLQHSPDPPDKEEIEGGAADSSIGAPSSSGGGSSSSGGKGGGGGDRHLRKLTQSLVEVLETMSSSVQPPPPGHSRSSSSAPQHNRARSAHLPTLMSDASARAASMNWRTAPGRSATT